MSLKSSRIAALVATAATVALLGVTAAPALAKGGDIIVPFNNWAVSGSITAKKLNQAINLRVGLRSTVGRSDVRCGYRQIDGSAVRRVGHDPRAPVEGRPEDRSGGTSTGTIVDDTTTPGDLDLSLTASQNLLVTSIGLFGTHDPDELHDDVADDAERSQRWSTRRSARAGHDVHGAHDGSVCQVQRAPRRADWADPDGAAVRSEQPVLDHPRAAGGPGELVRGVIPAGWR